MFRGHDSGDFAPQLATVGPAASAAVLSFDQILPHHDAPLHKQLTHTWHLQRAAIRRWLTARYHQFDMAHDLAEDIGSARWFRGAGVLLGLTGLALASWPDFSTLEAATVQPVADATRDEFRSQMILPLSLGSESGRRMGATLAVQPIAYAPERPSVQLIATLGEGDSFARMLQRTGASANDAARAADMVGAYMAASRIDPGTRFDITLGRRAAPGAPRPLDKLSFRARFDLNLDIARHGGSLVLSPRPIAIDSTPLRIRGTVGQGLYRSARAAGAPIKAVQQYLQTLDAHLSLDSDIAATDQFDFIVSYKRSANGESEVGTLLFAGLERGGQPVAQLLRWGDDGQFYEASGMNTQRAAVYAPVAGRLTSHYGMRRHPVLGYSRMHAGVDFGAAWGTPIVAVSTGVVTWAGPHGGHGNYVRLEHGGGLGTGYGHMSQIAVASGSKVQAGQVIGYVGSTGLSTGPHLHYEVYQDGRTVNPLTVRFAVNSQVDAKQLAAFKARLAALKKIAPGAALKPLGAMAPN